MKEPSKKNAAKAETKLFFIGLALVFCSVFLSTAIKLYTTFVFKPLYFRSLPLAEQQEWWFKLVDLNQASQFFRIPAVQPLTLLTICAALTGIGLISLSVIVGKGNEKRNPEEVVKQWLLDNPPKQKRRK